MKTRFLLACLILCAQVSCNTVDIGNNPIIDSHKPCYTNGVSSASRDITPEEAMTVATLFLANKTSLTKTNASSIVPIKDKNGTEQLYAVNYGEHYVLVPSTKAFVPIAGMAQGTYDDAIIIPQEQILIEEMCDIIAANRRDSCFTKYEDAWRPYKQKEVFNLNEIETRSSNPVAAYLEFCEEHEDVDVYLVSMASPYIPENIYQSFSSAVQHQVQSGGAVYPQFAIVTVDDAPVLSSKGPFTKTAWDQGFPYNSAVPGGYPLGCLTVAVGQLMRSYGIPAGIPWQAFPDSTSNTSLSNLLANIRTQLNIDDDGNGYSSSAVSYLTARTYDCSYITHNQTSVLQALTYSRPLIMYGQREVNDTTKIGHFWVCDGYRAELPKTAYNLYALYLEDGELVYEMISNHLVIGSWIRYFRMNWGWGGLHDGYFYSESVNPTSARNYSHNRHDLIITNKQAIYY